MRGLRNLRKQGELALLRNLGRLLADTGFILSLTHIIHPEPYLVDL